MPIEALIYTRRKVVFMTPTQQDNEALDLVIDRRKNFYLRPDAAVSTCTGAGAGGVLVSFLPEPEFPE